MATQEELEKQISVLMHQINYLSANYGGNTVITQDPYEEENKRIEKYLSDFTSRQGVLLTIAGLLTLLPLSEPNSLRHFLLWSFPILILAIATYTFSSKRINFVSRNEPQLISSWEVNQLLKKSYYNSMFFHKATDTLIVSFFVSFIASYYIKTFLVEIGVFENIAILVISSLAGIIRLLYISESSEIPLDYGAVGGPTPDEFGQEK